jgi:hypothetical protein
MMKTIATAASTAAINLQASKAGNSDRKPNGRYCGQGSLSANMKHSFWYMVDPGDNKEFFHFTSISRDSFQELVEILARTNESSFEKWCFNSNRP